MDESKYGVVEYEWFNCTCGDVHHGIRFVCDPEWDELWIEFRVNNYESFWKRLRAAFKYLFNIDNKDASYDSMLINRADAKRMIKILENLNER